MIEVSDMRARLLVAEAVAREAGMLAKRRFLDRSSFTVGFKGPQDYLTEVDGESEALIAARLGEAFPDDGFLGEETEERRGSGGAPIWVVDPIDGTANFARGNPHFCVSIACVAGRAIEVGVIYDPLRDELFASRRGGGATLDGVAMRVATTTGLDRSAVEIGWNVRTGAELYLGLIARVVATGAAPGRCGSGALGLAYVAAGRRDGYVEHHIRSWDCLAGILLVSEAGGYVSDFLAGEGLRKGAGLIAAAPGIRDALIATAAIEGIAL
jgi:myo-inositol-1(or 4)-monophosphatase